MRQADLNREVARATGESVNVIESLGFLFVETPAPRPRRRRRHRRRRWHSPKKVCQPA